MRSYTIWYLGFDSFDSIWFDWKYQICFEKKTAKTQGPNRKLNATNIPFERLCLEN